MPTRRLEVDGVGLVALEAGQGGRPLLLVHGFTGAKEDFGPAVEPLAERGWHVLAPDLRGHGESDQPGDRVSYTLERYADDVLGVADALGWERFVLLGHSMGGMVAQLVALRVPERLRALVLMNTSHAAPDGFAPGLLDLGKEVVRQGGLELLVSVRRQMEGDDPTAHKRLVEQDPEYAEFNKAKTLACSPAMWLAMVDEMFAQPDRLEALSGLAVPTLVVVGEQDDSFRAQSERIGRTIPGARLVVIPDAAHLPQFEATERWWAALTEFLDGLE